MKRRKDLDQDEIAAGQRHISGDIEKPKDEGINNTDVPGVPEKYKARNNPTGQDEGLSGYSGDSPLSQ